jgi:hypothetical protein
VRLCAGASKEFLNGWFYEYVERNFKDRSSVDGSTTTSPSGFATCEAIFARCFVRDANRNRKAKLDPHAAADHARNLM